MNQMQRLAHARSVLMQAETASGLTRTEEKEGWQTPEALTPVLPSLKPGILAVTGSATVLLSIAGQASSQGAWVALLGLPWVGWGAAAGHGLDLSRTAHIPEPGPRSAEVLTALADGFDVIATGRLGLSVREQRAIAQRVRSRGASILASEWSTASSTLHVEGGEVSGCEDGIGHVKDLRFTVSSGFSRVECLWTDQGLVPAPRILQAVS
ncbi:MAG: hypothetical protein ACTHV1_02380 [Flaviflexus sp.]|uniref:hypothetical protein n=1 Tax=Flaviflexus sp. TaxID=1969482 RepID=UPI003F9035FD